MIEINYRDSRSIYEQVKDELKKQIISGMLVAEDKLPSVRELAVKLAVNPNTIQRAYRELEQEGFVYTVKGKGCFVSGESNDSKKHIQQLYSKLFDTVKELRFLGITKKEVKEKVDEVFSKM